MRPTSPLLHSSRQLRQYVWRRELVPQGKTLASCMLPGSPKGSKHRVHTSPSSLQNSSPGPPAAERAAWSPALIIVANCGNGIFFYSTYSGGCLCFRTSVRTKGDEWDAA